MTLTYRYDLNNRMTEEARTEGGTTLRSGFAYDKAGQLTSFRRSDGYAEAYTYDPVGNMVEKVLNGTKIAMTYDAANELKTMENPHGKLTYIYDLNGNLTQKTLGDRTDTYSYDARNRLKQYRGYDNYQVKYSYSALGMLHARESSGAHSRTTLEELIAGKEEGDDPDGDDGSHITTYTYDLTQPYYQVLTETTDGATTAYTYGLERLAAYTENTRTAYLYDGRGSVIQTRGSLGTQTMAYSAYGEFLTAKVSGYGYNGEYYDAATGMLNLRARQYEPAQARFSQRDSLKGWVTSPRSLNAYLYCQNDAMNYFDASGAAMMAVNMTDGGGGKKSNSSSSNLLQKAGQTIKNVVSTVASAAAVAKAVNDQALANAQESSMFGVSSDPATVRHKARTNRAKAQTGTPTVRSTKQGACMSQEEHDSFWKKLYNYLFPSSCAPQYSPEPTPSPTPMNDVIHITIPEPPTTPEPTPILHPTVQMMMEKAESLVGSSYETYDCAEFVKAVYRGSGADTKMTASAYRVWNRVNEEESGYIVIYSYEADLGKMPIGSIIFYNDPKCDCWRRDETYGAYEIHHVAIYAGNREMYDSTDKPEIGGVSKRSIDETLTRGEGDNIRDLEIIAYAYRIKFN